MKVRDGVKDRSCDLEKDSSEVVEECCEGGGGEDDDERAESGCRGCEK